MQTLREAMEAAAARAPFVGIALIHNRAIRAAIQMAQDEEERRLAEARLAELGEGIHRARSGFAAISLNAEDAAVVFRALARITGVTYRKRRKHRSPFLRYGKVGR